MGHKLLSWIKVHWLVWIPLFFTWIPEIQGHYNSFLVLCLFFLMSLDFFGVVAGVLGRLVIAALLKLLMRLLICLGGTKA